MRPLFILIPVLALIVGVFAGRAPAQLRPLGPSPIIFPAQQLPLHFSHAQHLALADVGCGSCHDAAAGSLRAADDLIPREEACTSCHAIDRTQPTKQAQPAARCDACHITDAAGTVARVVVPAPNLKFNHKLHVDRKVRCQTCHDVQVVGLATRAELPRMPLCLSCHDGQTAPSSCTTCHFATGDGRVKTDLPEGQLVPSGALRGDAHDLRFRTDHASVAANDEGYCLGCHRRRDCLDCHNATAKPLDFHGGDYIAIHAVEARRGSPDCQSCHRLQTFCTGCHARTGVSDDPKTSGFQRRSEVPDGRRFHPEGWWATMTRGLRTGAHHAFQAQRNLRTCVSCHREEFCLECHARQIDPHPVGWRGSSRCKALLARNGRTCLRCHTQVEEIVCE